MKFLVLWHHRSGCEMNFEFQTTDVIECLPEDLGIHLMHMSTVYQRKELERITALGQRVKFPPSTKAHQILILP